MGSCDKTHMVFTTNQNTDHGTRKPGCAFVKPLVAVQYKDPETQDGLGACLRGTVMGHPQITVGGARGLFQ